MDRRTSLRKNMALDSFILRGVGVDSDSRQKASYLNMISSTRSTNCRMLLFLNIRIEKVVNLIWCLNGKVIVYIVAHSLGCLFDTISNLENPTLINFFTETNGIPNSNHRMNSFIDQLFLKDKWEPPIPIFIAFKSSNSVT